MKRDTIKFKAAIDGKELDFEIYAEATMLEKQQIENVVASFVGGHKELAKLKQATEIQKEELKKSTGTKEIFVNPLDLYIVSYCDESIDRGYWYGTLKVLLISPPINIDTLNSENFNILMSACGGALTTFSGQRKTTANTKSNN